MALSFSFIVGNNQTIGCWKFEENLKDLYTDVSRLDFNLSDFTLLNSLNRKIEWLSIRLLLRTLLPNDKVDIHYDEHGKPHLTDDKLKISISHSKGMCAMYLSPFDVGIDLQILNEGIENIKSKFLNNKECNLFKNQLEDLHYFWCAKESVFKAYGRKKIFLKQNINIKEIQREKKTIKAILIDGNYSKSFDLKFRKIENYYMAYTTNG